MREYTLEIAKRQAKDLVKEALEIDESKIQILYPPAETGADLAIPLFAFAKEKKQNPKQLAEDVTKKSNLSNTLISQLKAEKGYVNFYFDWDKFNSKVFEDFSALGENYGGSEAGNGKTIVIDLSSPNIAKPFSIGHLRSTNIGDSIYKIYELLGYTVIGDNHIGDWGTQFGKLIAAYNRWGNKETIEKEPIKELLDLYVKFHEEAEVNQELEKEARKSFKNLEENKKKEVALWKWFKDLSLKEFDRIYDILGMKFDVVLGESFYNNILKKVVDEALEKGVAEWSEVKETQEEEIVEEKVREKEKVALVWLKNFGIDAPLLLQKSDGTSLYATREIATLKYRIEKWNPSQILYVVGGEQQLYFKQCFKVFELLGYNAKCVHVWFGLIRLPEGRMSTRKGRVIFLEDVLNEAVDRAKAIIKERDMPEEEKRKVAKMVGTGAVKYADLSQDRTKDVVFDWDKMLSLEGNSAPYIQYAHTRAASILRKSKLNIAALKDIFPKELIKKEEMDLVKRIAQFPEIIFQAAENYEPSCIANYLFGLAQSFNRFYTNIPVLKEEKKTLKNTRLVMVNMIRGVIKKGLSLLGIESPEKM